MSDDMKNYVAKISVTCVFYRPKETDQKYKKSYFPLYDYIFPR